MSPVTISGLFVVLLVATASQAASIGGGTAGAGVGLPAELQAQLNTIYYAVQKVVAEMRTNGTGLAPGARAYIWQQLDVLEDQWRANSAEELAKMPGQMVVVANVSEVYAADVENEIQWLEAEAQERAQALVDSLRALEAAMKAGAASVVQYGASQASASASASS